MNASTVKGVIFIAGALVGSAITYILCSKSAKDNRDELVASYEAEIKKLNEKIYSDDIPQETQEASKTEDPMKFKSEEKVDYTNFFKPENVNGPAVNLASYNDIVQSQACPSEDDNTPVLITQEVYETNPMGYTKFELQYYMDDDYLCDVEDMDTPIMDIEKFVGYDNLEVFKQTDEEYIWIINHNTKSLVEVEVYRNGPCPINDLYEH